MELAKAAGVIIRAKNTGRVLLCHRTDGQGWAWPAGGFEDVDGDDPAKCAWRECFEETNYRLGDVGQLLMHSVKGGVDFTTFLTECESEFTPQLQHEHDAFAWVDPRAILDEAKLAHHDATYGSILPPPTDLAAPPPPLADSRADDGPNTVTEPVVDDPNLSEDGDIKDGPGHLVTEDEARSAAEADALQTIADALDRLGRSKKT